MHDEIQRNRGAFREEVFGPMLLYVTVEGRYAPFVDHAVRSSLLKYGRFDRSISVHFPHSCFRFLAASEADRDKLQQMSKQMGAGATVLYLKEPDVFTPPAPDAAVAKYGSFKVRSGFPLLPFLDDSQPF